MSGEAERAHAVRREREAQEAFDDFLVDNIWRLRELGYIVTHEDDS